MEFSLKQKLALQPNNGKNILVSAGAGSGKTTVLTERVYQLIKNGAKIDRFLILTFTNLAAASMKSKIRKKLLNDSEFSHLSSEVDLAHIETFDAFCLFLVKKYAYKLGITSDLSIGDATIFSIKKKEITDSVFGRLYSEKDPLFVDLITKNCVKDDAVIITFVNSICDLANKKINKYEFLDNYINDYYKNETIENFINEGFIDIRKSILDLRRAAEYLEDSDDASAICNFLDEVLESKDYDSIINRLKQEEPQFPKKNSKVKTTDKNFRDTISSGYRELKKKDYGSSEEIKRLFFYNQKTVAFLINIAKEIEQKMEAFMKEYNIFDFASIARMTVSLLNDKEVLEETKNSFDFILVDEYQDTNDVQEEVISKLSRNNLYMVGDVKQSIYRFRNANCQIFQNKYDDYKDETKGTRIDLNTSYRSRKEIVDAVNEMFEQIMVKSINPIDYKDGHCFEFGQKAYLDNKEPGIDYSLKVYNYPAVKGSKTADAEARIIANDIVDKINSGYKVYKNSQLIPCSFSDFAIIIDRSTNFDKYKSVFAEYNIPLKVVGSESLTTSDITYVIKNLLKLIYKASNNEYDKEYDHAFFSIARSFVVAMKDDILFEVNKTHSYLTTELGQKIELLKCRLKNSSLSIIFSTLVREFDIYNRIITIGKFSANSHKLEMLRNLAKNMDLLGFSLKDFVNYFDDLSTYDLDIDFTDNDTIENSVTLITIHKSKGLEYAICYYPGLGKQFKNDTSSSFIASTDYGLLMPYTEENAPTSLLNHLYREKEKKDDLEEKIRLFYVALTRAKERIILLNPVDKEKPRGPIPVLNKLNCFLPLIYYTNFDLKYGVDVNSCVKTLKYEENAKAYTPVTLQQIKTNYKPIEIKHASKENDEKIDSKKLEFGTKLHAYLEAVDFIKKDVSFIADEKIKRYVNNVINNRLFDNLNNTKVLHEYHFYDENNDVNGIIDLLIVRDNEIDIIDFKLKNIDDEAYKKQLLVYHDFIKTISTKPIKMFLVAAITGKEEEIYA